MSLHLLAPLALGLGALLAGPVLAHLARQHPRERVAYGAMLLIDRLPRKIQRQRHLRDRLILAFRVLALLGFLVAAAQPELRLIGTTPTFGGTGRVVVILDDSLSMDQRIVSDPAYAIARKDAAATVRALPEGVRVAVVTAGAIPDVLTPLTADTALSAALIESHEATDGGTNLHEALTLVREMLGGEPGEVIIYTDESGPGVVDACALDIERLLATGSAVIPRVYAAEPRRNIVGIDAVYGDGLEGGTVTAHLLNYGPDAVETEATIALPDGARITTFVDVPGSTPAGPGAAEERFTVPRQAAGGVATLTLTDGELTRDNARRFHLPRIGASRVLVIDGDPGSTPTRSEVYFLERALAPWGQGAVTVDVVASSGLSSLSPTTHRVAWLANVADPGPYAPLLVDFVRQGGGLVIAMGDLVTADRYNGPLASLLPAPLRKVRDLSPLDAVEGEALTRPDTSLDLFAPFAGVGAGAFERIRARRAMTVEGYADSADVHTLLRFASGVPALIEREIGNGRVFLWTSTLDLGWGNAPVESVFPPLVQRITAYLGGDAGGDAVRAGGVVGHVISVSLPAGSTSEVTGPDGSIVPAERGPRGISFLPTKPGAYAAGQAGEPPLAWVAVNTDPAESDVRSSTSLLATAARVDPERMAEHIPLWTWVILVGCLGLLASAVLGRGADEAAA